MQKIIGGTTVSAHDFGYTFGNQTLGDGRANGINGNNYTDIETKHSGLSALFSGKGGVSREPLTDLDPLLKQQFTKITVGMADTVSQAAQTLGLLPKDIEAAMSTVDIGKILGDISLQGLDPAKYQQALEAKFGLLGDSLAMAVMPGIEKLSKVGEGAMTTLVRVAQSFETASYWVKALGNNTKDVFGAMGIVAGTAAINIVELAGGLDKFNTAMEAHVAASMTDVQQADLKRSGGRSALDSIFNSKPFKDLGVAAPQSWAEFNKIVNGLDLTTEAGKQMYVTLVTQASPAFLAVNGSAQKAADAIKSLQQALDAFRPAKTGSQLQSAVDTDMLNIQANSFGGIRTFANVLALTDEQIGNMSPNCSKTLETC